MTLTEFLKITKKEGRREEIVILEGEEAIEAVKRDGYSLQYVNIKIFED